MAKSNQFHDMLTEVLPRLRGYAVMLTRDRTAAEDLLQETAFRALRAESQFTLGTNFSAWMYRILHNTHISMARRAKRSPASLDDVPEELVSRGSDQEERVLTQEIVRAMDKLQPCQREVLVLICAGGCSYEEAAEMLKCSVGTIKSRLWRARRKMQAIIMGDEVQAVEASDAPDKEIGVAASEQAHTAAR